MTQGSKGQKAVHEQVAKLGPVSRAAGMDCECPFYLETRKTPKSIIISQLDGIWQRASDFVRMQIVISVDSPAGLQCVCRQL